MGLKTQRGSIEQREHIDDANAHAGVEIVVPGTVLTDDFSLAWTNLGIRNYSDCRIRVQVTADTYIAFAEDDAGTGVSTGAAAVDATSSPAVKLEAGYHTIQVTRPFMRASANPARVEVFK